MRRVVGVAVLVFALAGVAAAPAPAAVAPYGTDDAGGFRNILPPGEAGTDNAIQLAAFRANNQRPAHWMDQQPLYENLLYASPALTHDQVAAYYKDATFGVRPEDVETTETPRPGLTIIRDKQYGVPHVYGDSRADVMFGAGYAGAEDRLFLMDVLRHTGRAELSSFAGGAKGNREMDRVQWALAPYTEADLQRQIDQAPVLGGAEGAQLVQDVTNYVAGINAYIAKARLDPTKMPGEYAAFGKQPEDWKVTDVIAEASLIGGIFGKGGGNELRSALLLEALQKRFGDKRGRRVWSDFRLKNDPEAPSTIRRKRFPYETTPSFAPRGLALPDPGSVTFLTPGGALAGEPSGSARTATPLRLPIPDDGSIGSQLLRQFVGEPPHASNWELVSARESTTGHAIGVLGPQVGYFVPQILMEEDLHGPGIDARGATFPGVNLYVQLGHGRDYAWSATTATSDNVDTFAEVLCQDDTHYLYRGECRAMDELDVTNSWKPNVSDQTPPGSETLSVYRTVHGIVFARGKVGGKDVAFVTARTTYFHEADSALGFLRLNDPNFVKDPQSFRRAIDGINFAFNWSYIDADHIAYQLSGAYPYRSPHTSSDFPILGTGEYDWQGFDPDRYLMSTVPLDKRPHAVDPPYLVSWNNKQAPGWAAADDKFSYGPVFRSRMIEQRVRQAIKGPRKMALEQLVQAMEEPATQDIRAFALTRPLLRALGHPSSPTLRAEIDHLRAWAASGGHRRDLDKDGRYDDDQAVTLMDAWWPRMLDAIYQPVLGDEAFKDLKDMLGFGGPPVGEAATDYPGFSDGWWSYVNKDLRDMFNHRKPLGRLSRGYCGNGSRQACRLLLRRTLLDALTDSHAKLYGYGDCQSDPQARCFDQDRFTTASAVGVPNFPFQNRPTFQQTVELTQRLPR
ncbi:MAG: penicillin acylase family protein [Actinobacteria bacterium]|nr:MAG: penicillin acylase family protein [Actinomycetota bacterium]